MLDRLFVPLVFIAAIGTGVVGGVFYAFSTFVMTALGRLPPVQGAAAMKTINITVINPLFMTAFFGTALICLALAAASFAWPSVTTARLVLAAALLYLVGCIGVTVLANVPLNDRLAAVAQAEEAAVWARYLDVWTLWNHVRTAASILAGALFIMALTV
ncbi:anthrone oxygenase family protein [Chelatococcus reniformis]|uniref:Membrane protein n=1 Tax=Chelatococcus reniformis TaxID=1494448 RepID=A0A916XB47_9HYPH|nr:anthrone oxygenase family protein [Chelatococcus reniformis]GGC60427.1 membrane protein [Chelatococcus reniformis]